MPLEHLAILAETRRFVRLPDGRLLALFLANPTGLSAPGASPEAPLPARLMMACSTDHGSTWSAPEAQYDLATDSGSWFGWDALVDQAGELHVFTLHDRGTGVAGRVLGEGDKNCRKLYGACLDIWHLKTSHGRSRWQAPRRIWAGYTGSLNSVMQLSSGRLVLAFSYRTGRHWFNRSPGLDNFSFHGHFACTVLISDDAGDTWQTGTPDLQVWVPEPTNTYGAVEPAVLQLRDGRVWMLLRTQTGRLYEAFSPDGAEWSIPRPTRLASSDSPVGLVRLADGRIVLLWNACLRYPYAYGGRQVLHAAISADEGRTWQGMRECARDPQRLLPPPNQSGDFGTAYPYPLVTGDQRVLFATGQGHGRVQMIRFDPDWLLETVQHSQFDDADAWQIFGTAGVSLEDHPELPARHLLRLRKVQPGPTAAAVWNFPVGARGRLTLQLRAVPGAAGLRLSLADHFSTPFDPEDDLWSCFNLRLGPALVASQWQILELAWDCDGPRQCRAWLAGRELSPVHLEHATAGVCYLRLVSTPQALAETDPAGYEFATVSVNVGTGASG